MDLKKLWGMVSMTDKEKEVIEEARNHSSGSLKENSLNLLFKFYKNPKKKVKKFIKNIKKKRRKPKFIGWGMQTVHELPWNGGIDNETFLKAANDVKSFKFANQTGWYADRMDQLLWRHWVISFSIRYVMKFIREREISLVECGVAYGVSASFVLRELQDKKDKGQIDQFYMHLYDAWVPTNKYGAISVELTRKNLSEFAENVICHEGFIPDSLSISPPPPEELVFLHIDLNSAPATLAVLDFFYPKLRDRGIILFDDYGWESYIDTKKVVDEFFADKHGILMPLPTGQAIFFR
jgi:hypothetical protein